MSTPNVLIIGDSISIGYEPTVTSELSGLANVTKIVGNGQKAANCASRMQFEWYNAFRNYDLICMNAGLWDINDAIGKTGSAQYALDVEDMIKITLSQNTRTLVSWVTTTDVPEGSASRTEEDRLSYQAAIDPVLAAYPQIEICDIVTAALANPDWHQTENVHFETAGYTALGELVAAHVADRLNLDYP